MGLQSTEINRVRKKKSRRARSIRRRTDSPWRTISSGGEIKRALVESAGARLLAPDARSESRFKHVLLQPADDRIFFEKIKNGRMAFQDFRPVFVRREKLGHITFAITDFRQPLCAFDHVISFDFRLQVRRPLFKYIVENL